MLGHPVVFLRSVVGQICCFLARNQIHVVLRLLRGRVALEPCSTALSQPNLGNDRGSMSKSSGTRIFVSSVWRGNGSQNFRPRGNNRIEMYAVCLCCFRCFFFPKRRRRKPQLVLKAQMVRVFLMFLLARGVPGRKFTSKKNLVILSNLRIDSNVCMEFKVG